MYRHFSAQANIGSVIELFTRFRILNSTMTYFKRPLFRTLATVLVAFTLLLQVQNSFACEMMDTSGPVSACCCELELSADCCELDGELVLVGADLEADDPAAARTHAKLSAPETVSFILVSLLWPSVSPSVTLKPVRYEPVATIGESYPPIYSLTQRFRI